MIKFNLILLTIKRIIFETKQLREICPKYKKHVYFYFIALWVLAFSTPFIPFQYVFLYLVSLVVIILFWMCCEKETRIKVFRFIVRLLLALILLSILFIFLGQWFSGGKF
ncbi:MAG: hypothetical protein E7021_00360 [Alphaproteobacteria bacterium]|nr:hypothetical protein [Alphaproteobacteria bacterium]